MDLNIVILLIKTAYYKILNHQNPHFYWLNSHWLLDTCRKLVFGGILKSIFELFAVKSTQLFLNKRLDPIVRTNPNRFWNPFYKSVIRFEILLKSSRLEDYNFNMI